MAMVHENVLLSNFDELFCLSSCFALLFGKTIVFCSIIAVFRYKTAVFVCLNRKVGENPSETELYVVLSVPYQSLTYHLPTLSHCLYSLLPLVL